MSTTRVTHARHRRKYNFHLYIHKVLKALDQGFKISKNAMEISDSCVEDLCHRIISQAAELVKINGRKTFTEKSMYTATRMVIGDSPLCNAAVVEGVDHMAGQRIGRTEEADVLRLTVPRNHDVDLVDLRVPLEQDAAAPDTLHIHHLLDHG